MDPLGRASLDSEPALRARCVLALIVEREEVMRCMAGRAAPATEPLGGFSFRDDSGLSGRRPLRAGDDERVETGEICRRPFARSGEADRLSGSTSNMRASGRFCVDLR